MRSSIKSYPYPVLGNGNDIAGIFHAQYSKVSGPDYITIRYRFELTHPTLLDLIEKGQACFCIQLECKSTFYRFTYSTGNFDGEFTIDPNLVRDRVEISFYICAAQTIRDYQPVACHPDYEGELFTVESGDVLAEGGTDDFLAIKSFDALRAPMTSFIGIVSVGTPSGPIRVNYEGDERLLIELPQREWEGYASVRQSRLSSTIHASVVLPALVDIFNEINGRPNEYIEKNWYLRLQDICRERNIPMDDALEAAQRILNYPVFRSQNELTSLMAEDKIEELA